MTPEERIRAVLETSFAEPASAWSKTERGVLLRPRGMARAILAADPTIAADLELAAAIRRLRQAGPGRLEISDSHRPNEKSWYASVWSAGKQLTGWGDTLTEAIEDALR